MNQTAPSTRKLMKLAMNALQKHRGQEAIDLLQQVLQLNPQHAEALHQTGYMLHGSGNYPAAADFYQRAISADPQHIESYLLLSKLMESQGRSNEALQLAQHATRIAPDDARTHAELVSLLLRFHKAHLVTGYLEPLLPKFAGSVELQQFYCLALKLNGRFAEAETAYRKLLAGGRVPASFRIMFETYLPRLNRSAEEIDMLRSNFKESVEKFIAEKPRIDLGLLSSHPLFFLAFHNRDNKELTQLYTKMLRLGAPQLNYVAPHCKLAVAVEEGRPLRIGFISSHLHNHSVGNCYRGAMLHLAAQPEFAVTFFNLADVMDEKIQLIVNARVPMVQLPKNIAAAQELVAGHRLDLVLYPDIGMDAATHYLAMARLAPRQACFQGHPETTGIDTIDYVISSRSYEPEHADENYTEQLLCNAGVDTVFTRPVPPPRWLTREELKLPTDRKLYVCPMAIQKFHPDFDAVLADILARDPDATLVLFNDFHQQSASEMLQQRILAQCDPSRVLFLGWQPLATLFSILKAADAILDTIHFGAGTTAQYAFGFGLPIVTLPGRYARGRVVHSYYRLMGIDGAPEAKDTQEYAALAVKLANDTAYQESLSAQILARNSVLWDGEPYGPKLVQLVKDIVGQDLAGYRR